MSWLQIADELRAVVKHARQATVVHLASEALPKMSTDAAAYIHIIEDTAEAASKLVDDYEGLHTYAYSADGVMLGHCTVWV